MCIMVELQASQWFVLHDKVWTKVSIRLIYYSIYQIRELPDGSLPTDMYAIQIAWIYSSYENVMSQAAAIYN